jgi:hypothetical protein
VFGRIHNFVDQRCKEGNVAKDRGIHKLTEIAGLFFGVAGVVDGGDVGAFVTGYSVIIVVGRGSRFFVRIDIVTFGNGKCRLLAAAGKSGSLTWVSSSSNGMASPLPLLLSRNRGTIGPSTD